MQKQIQLLFSKDSRSGQSLIEVIVGLAIGAILMGASAFAIAGMIQTNNTSQKWRSATALAQGLLTNTRAYGTVNWQNLYGLSKGSGSDYFLNASGTTYNVIWGKEGMLDNDVTSGLVGEWKFDEDIGTTSTLTYDATGNGNNGILNSATRTTSTCKIGNCLSFASGTSAYVGIPDQNSLDFGTGSFSVALWAYHQAYSYPQTFFPIRKSVACQSAGNPGWDIGQGYSATGISICLNDGTTGGITYVAFDAGYRPTDLLNKWAHLVVVFDRSAKSIKFYVNGVKQTNERDISTITGSVNNTAAVSIGNVAGWLMYGLMDDVRIYNRALSAYEVGQLYNSNVFRRYFYVENTCRTNDASSSISGVSPCAVGSADDPSTQKISAITEWTTPTGANPQVLLSDYVTRWKNSVFQQNDWSGGPNASGVITNPTNLFSSSSGINFSGKSLRIQGL